MVPGLAASAQPENLLVMQIPGPSEAETLGVGPRGLTACNRFDAGSSWRPIVLETGKVTWRWG